MSGIRTVQRQIAKLILADLEWFCRTESMDAGEMGGVAYSSDLVPVVLELPGDLDAEVEKAMQALGVGVVVWQPSFNVEGNLWTYTCKVWVKENVLMNRGEPGAKTADEIAERICTAVIDEPNGFAVNPRVRLGVFRGDTPTCVSIASNESNDYELTFKTEVAR